MTLLNQFCRRFRDGGHLPNPFRHSWLDQAQLGMIALLLGFAVFSFGGTEAWSQVVLCLLVSVLGVLILLRPLVDREFTIQGSWMWLPMGALLLLFLTQLVQLPSGLVGWLSPARVTPYESMGAAAVAAPNPTTLTVSTLATQHSLRFGLMAAFALLAVTSYLRTQEQVEKLLLVVFGIGCAQSLLALAQIVTGADKLYWTVNPGAGGMMTAGSFVNHSHFAQFVNLAIGAGIGLLFLRLDRVQHMRIALDGAWRFDSLATVRRQNWLLGGLVICMLAVCLSLSRNGILSLAIAAAITGSLLSLNHSLRWRGWVVSLVPLAAFGLLMFVGFDAFYNRLGTLEEADVYQDRWQLSLDSLRAGADYLLLGSGAGTYSLVFPQYDTTDSASVAAYADNDYAQLFVEGGLVGCTILAMLAAVIILFVVKSLKTHHSAANQAAFGLLTGVVAVAIHGLTDFGQRLPAVFLLSVTLCGTLATIPRIRWPGGDGPVLTESAARWHRPWLRSLAMAAVASVVGVWMVRGALLHYEAESWWAVAQCEQQRLEQNDWKGSRADYYELLLASENATVWEPGDVVMQYWLNQYRWQAVLNTIPEATSPTEAIAAIRPIARQIADELSYLRERWPTYHSTYLLEGQLRGYVLGQTEVATALFSRGADLAKSDPQAQFACGTWAAEVGDEPKAAKHFTRAIAINPGLYPQVATLLVNELDAAEVARSMAGDNLDRLEALLAVLDSRPTHTALAGQLQDEVHQRLVDLADSGAANGAQLARLAQVSAESGDLQQAIEMYRRALATNFNRFEWRMGLARSLRAVGEIEAARREVRICMRLRPRDGRALRLIEEMAVEIEPVESPDSSEAGLQPTTLPSDGHENTRRMSASAGTPP